MSNYNGRSSLISTFLFICFTAIVMYVLFGILSLHDKTGGVARIVFSIVNCLVLIGLSAQSSVIARLTSNATVIQLWSVTVFYTVFQFGAVFIGIDSWYGNLYVLYQLIVLFLYLCIALPVLNISYRKNKNSIEEN